MLRAAGELIHGQLLGRTGLSHGFTTRRGGVSTGPFASLNLSERVGDRPDAVAENRRRWAAACGRPWSSLVGLEQVHGAEVLVVDRPPSELPPEDARCFDASATDRTDAVLCVRTADCLPVLLHDPVRRAVAAVHAGWRGSLAGVSGAAVAALREAFGCRPEDLLAVLGPCIGPEAFEVGPEVHAAFLARHGPGVALGRLRVDLCEANRRQLLGAGLLPGHLEAIGGCTSAQPELFFSHRRDSGRTGRQLAFIGLDPAC